MQMRPQASPSDASPPGHTELSRLWLRLSLGGVRGIKREGTSRGQHSPLGDWILGKGRVPLPVHKLQPDTREVLAAPARSAPPGLGCRERVPPPVPPLPQPQRRAAAGRGKGHFGAEWEPVGTWWRGACQRHSLPSPRAQPPPSPPRPQHPSPHLSSPAKACSGPPPGARAPRNPLAAQSAGRGGTPGEGVGGRSLRVATAGRGLHSLENGRGRGGPCRPRDGKVGGGLQESLSGKALHLGGLGGWRN